MWELLKETHWAMGEVRRRTECDSVAGSEGRRLKSKWENVF